MIDREPIYSAIYSLLQTVQGFRTVSRRLKLWSDETAGPFPAVYMVQAGEDPTYQTKGLPALWTLRVDLLLYTYQSDQKSSPMPQANNLVSAIEALLATDNSDGTFFTLGGLVNRCWIEGSVEYFEGVTADMTICVIPLTILAN